MKKNIEISFKSRSSMKINGNGPRGYATIGLDCLLRALFSLKILSHCSEPMSEEQFGR